MVLASEFERKKRDTSPIRLLLTDIEVGENSPKTEVSGKVVKILRGHKFVRIGDRINFEVEIGRDVINYSQLLNIQRIDGYFQGTAPNLEKTTYFLVPTESEYEELMKSKLFARIKELWANLWRRS